MTRALLLFGPTASGKSALALALAERLDGVIVNADSMQVYRDLRVLTARPSPQEERAAPHRLYGFVDAAERFSVGAWARAAAPVIQEALQLGRTPIVVGGTGLYFRALTRGLAAAPSDPSIRALLDRRLAAEGPAALHAELAARDPETATRLEPADAPRILRALEVLEATGESITALQRAQTTPALAAEHWTGVALAPPRDALYAAIDARFEGMLLAGALSEARALAARRLDPSLPAMKAHGMPWLAAHVRGETPLPEAVSLSQRDTRRYAKRQGAWMRTQLEAGRWRTVTETDPAARVAAALAALKG